MLHHQEPNYQPQNNIFWQEERHWALQALENRAAVEVRALQLCHLCADVGSVQTLMRHSCIFTQKYISLCFSFNCSQPKGSSHSKGHFLGSVNHQPGLIQYFCLTSKSLSPSWPGVLGCFSKRCWIPQGKFRPGIIKVNGSPHPSSFTENCSYLTFSTELHERALHRGGTAHCKKCMQLFSIIWNTWRIQH